MSKTQRDPKPRVQAPKQRSKKSRRPAVPTPRSSGQGPRSRRLLYGVVAGGAALLALVLVLASVLSSNGDSGAPTGSQLAIGGAETTQLLQGIPQDGIALGLPDAPVTLVEWADMQCPFCAEWSGQTFDELVRDYVRPGKVRLEFHGMDFVGPDSERGLRFVLAAAEQDRLWNVVHLLFANQGEENSGWLTDEVLTSVGRASGLDVDQAFADLDGDAVAARRDAAAASAEQYGISTTPSFAAGRTGRPFEVIELTSLEPGALTPTLDELLGQ
jgi:protein-disulfide isomerase